MVHALQRLREPAVIVVVVVLALRVLLGVLSFVHFSRGSSFGDVAFSAALFSVTYTATDALTVVVCAVLVGSCVFRSPTAHARTLAVWALAVAGVGVLLALIAAVVWLIQVTSAGANVLDTTRVLVGLVLPVLGVVGLGALVRTSARSTAEQTPALEPASSVAPPREIAPPDPATQPTWQPDQAAGAAWLKAGDAAKGAAASGWGTPGDPGGWLPRPDDDPGHSTPGLEQQPRS